MTADESGAVYEDAPDCDHEGCTLTSAYLLAAGSLCFPHAYEQEPATVERMFQASGDLPPAVEGEQQVDKYTNGEYVGADQ